MVLGILPTKEHRVVLKFAVLTWSIAAPCEMYDDIEKWTKVLIYKHINKCLLNDRAKVQELIDKGIDQKSKEINNAFK